jgi:DNA invertase Pin-like site-specific DNA recombinase
MATVCAYIRVSSVAQNLATQQAAIEKAAAARGDVIGRWYAEKKSGKALARPELDKLRVDARAGSISKLYVYRLDRLTRSGIRDTFDVIEELRAAGCPLVSIADGFDLAGPAAEVVLAVLAWAAKAERAAINERISAARERVEAEGKTWGRPRRLAESQVKQVRSLRAEGRSLRQVAVALKIPLATVARAARACQNDGAISA